LAFGPARQGWSKSGRQSGASGAVESVKRPLVDHLDAILTSVGSKDQPGRFWSGEFFRQGEIDSSKAQAIPVCVFERISVQVGSCPCRTYIL
jgi:hypothetical protein